MSRVAPRPGTRAVAIGMVATTLGILPAYLTAGMAVFLRDDLDFSRSALGLAMSVFFLVSALGSVPAGRFAEARGTRLTLASSALIAGVSLGGIALARTWPQLLAALVIGGMANAMTAPASNRYLVDRVRLDRRGLAMAIKQTSFPLATFGSGLAVPVIGLTIGWRWAFVLASVVAVAACVHFTTRIPPDPERTPTGTNGLAAAGTARGDEGAPTRPEPDQPMWILVVLAFGASLGTAAGSSLASFYVESTVDGGLAAGAAGVGLAAGSLFGVLARLSFGAAADRMTATLRFRHVAGLFVIGGVGMLGFAGPSTNLVLLLVTTALAFGAGWGWHGLFHLAIVQASPSAPAASTGVVMVGLFLGGIYGPAAFGFIADTVSFAASWTFLSISLLCGAVILAVVDRRVRQHAPPT